MIGIIYKFTILAKIKRDGHKPFYIGQHWCKSKDDFLCRDYPYYGSGHLWCKFLKKLRIEYPLNWKFFIKREILSVVVNDSQSTLDKLEEFWIKKEKAHYSNELGGCNILEGSPNGGIFNPMKDPEVARRVSYKLRHGCHHDVSGKKNPNYGHGDAIRGKRNPMKDPEVARKNAELRKGQKRTLEQRKRMSMGRRGKCLGKNNPNYGRVWTKEMRLRLSLKKRGLL